MKTPLLHQEMDKLHRYFDRLTSCHVIVEAPHRPHRQGEPFRIHSPAMFSTPSMDISAVTFVATPEPGSATLLTVAGIAILGRRRHRV